VRRLAVGLIGAGKHGARYAQHLVADVPDLRLAAVCRRDATAGSEQARRLGCTFHADWRTLVDDPAVEAVAVVVPPTLHPAIVDAVAAAQKPLLIEKPLATTGEAARRLVERVQRAGIPCLMAHTLRWNGVVQVLRDALREIGPLQALFLNQRFEPSSLAWLDDPAVSGGGIVLHTGVHSFDLVRYLTGCEVVRVSCRWAQVATRRTEDNFMALLELAGSPALVAVNGSRSSAGRSGLIDVAGRDGQAVGDHALGFAYRVRAVAREGLPVGEPTPTVREALRAFGRLAFDGERPRASIEDGARAVLIAEACRRAADRDTAVVVEPL
jgi:predicted dehydrogenase